MEQMITNRKQVEDICFDTFKQMIFEHEAIKLELEQLKNGTRVMLPVNKEHAKMMMIIGMNYLGIKPGEPVSYGEPNDLKSNTTS